MPPASVGRQPSPLPGAPGSAAAATARIARWIARWIAALIVAPAVATLLSGCAPPTVRAPASSHLGPTAGAAHGTPPPPVAHNLALPPPDAGAAAETYSVVVNEVPVHELLFALARDARLNVDIAPGLRGTVTLNAVDQTLPQLLARIARQADMRYELDGPTLAVMPDTPYLHSYAVDYVAMSRDTTASVIVTTQLVGAGAGGSTPPPASSAGSNNSMTRIENKAQHRFWETLVQNVKDLLHETDRILPDGSSETVTEQSATQSTTGTGAPPPGGHARPPAGAGLAPSPNPATLQDSSSTIVRRATFREAAAVIAHPETGILSVRATARQHENIQEFLARVQASARREVLIEATIVEVELDRSHQQGIDWSRLLTGAAGFTFKQSSGGFPAANASGILGSSQAGYANRNDGFTATITLLDAFGTTRVLSSPKIAVLNNQTAILKVVDNTVYFTLKADISQNQTQTLRTYTSTLNQVPVGFVMNVTPQIGEDDSVLLNVRPSLSRIIGTLQDPNPALRAGTDSGLAHDIPSAVPIIRVREMESVLRIQDGSIAVMGGLMEDGLTRADNGVPALSRAPLVGELFNQRDDRTAKTELVIFLRPTIIRDPSLDGDFARLRNRLPERGFFAAVPDPADPAAADDADAGGRP